jgi:hypothetical protein
MRATLSPRWELTTEHAASRNGQAVLVDRAPGEAFGPADLGRLHEGKGTIPAALAVRRLALTAELDTAEWALVARFVALLPSP